MPVSALASRPALAPVRDFRVGQVWAPRKRSGSCERWTIVALSAHPTCPVVAQADCGSVREFDWRGFFGGAEENDPSDLDLVTLLEDAPH